MTDFEQVRGEAVAEGVRRDTFLDICEQSGLSDRALQRVSAYVVAAENAGSGVHREAGRREDKLPDPLASGLAGPLFGVNPKKLTDADFEKLMDRYRLIRIQRKEAVTGPGGPGDLAWVWPLSTLILLLLWFRRRSRFTK